ncbi:hypothetical protein DM860_007814 [Cuscuta australis]|uniref:Uncharacterized protein n=1 Tax=Cuscuta australis TaxID=267555 RepID=A0A328DY43_9ASTE|nr:hypothetical protein DM860_007814 [Cuscuta australis]
MKNDTLIDHEDLHTNHLFCLASFHFLGNNCIVPLVRGKLTSSSRIETRGSLLEPLAHGVRGEDGTSGPLSSSGPEATLIDSLIPMISPAPEVEKIGKIEKQSTDQQAQIEILEKESAKQQAQIAGLIARANSCYAKGKYDMQACIYGQIEEDLPLELSMESWFHWPDGLRRPKELGPSSPATRPQ